ncbi:MAG: site-specific DNA-methyltransferase [Candidatus Korobacteraceae bacterium]
MKTNGTGNFSTHYNSTSAVTLFQGDCLEFLSQIPSGAARLIVTSPPYNIGKQYERRLKFEHYLEQQEQTLTECVRTLADDGSLCWQVGNHIAVDGEIYPLDIYIYRICKSLGLKLRNRIAWCFEHGLHCRTRLSGRYETILWFTKTDKYVFNLDPIRVPQKYPGKKHFKGPKVGQYSCNPLGKNPGDVWAIPNVKHNHVEKTLHPCQFPIELVERLVLALTNPGDLIIDPYMGVGSAACAAVLHKRRTAGADLKLEYLQTAKQRIQLAMQGRLPVRPLGKQVYVPGPNDKIARRPSELVPPNRNEASHSATRQRRINGKERLVEDRRNALAFEWS